MRLEHGTIILESAIDQNITFWARGRGAVNMHTETGVYSLSHQMVGANSDIMNRLDSMEQHMRTSLTLSEQLDSLRGQVQEIVSIWKQRFLIRRTLKLWPVSGNSVPKLGHGFSPLWLHFYSVFKSSCFQSSKNCGSFTRS